MSLRWTDRTFEFSMPTALHPIVVERLRGTPARIEAKVRSLPTETLTRREGDQWSIQEQVGHLLDLDELHSGRLDDYLAGAEVLRAADMTNRRTGPRTTTPGRSARWCARSGKSATASWNASTGGTPTPGG